MAREADNQGGGSPDDGSERGAESIRSTVEFLVLEHSLRQEPDQAGSHQGRQRRRKSCGPLRNSEDTHRSRYHPEENGRLVEIGERVEVRRNPVSVVEHFPCDPRAPPFIRLDKRKPPQPREKQAGSYEPYHQELYGGSGSQKGSGCCRRSVGKSGRGVLPENRRHSRLPLPACDVRPSGSVRSLYGMRCGPRIDRGRGGAHRRSSAL